MKNLLNGFLKSFGPKVFNEGLGKCNALGKRLIKKRKVVNFLDVGCASGHLTLDFAKAVKAKNIYGVEFVKKYKEECLKKGIKCQSQDLNKNWEFQDNFFDLILSSQNIEHMHDTRLYLKECYRCLKPGGQAVILSENLASWINIFSLLFGFEPFSSTGIGGESAGNPLHVKMEKNDWLDEKNALMSEEYEASGISGVAGHVRVLSYQGIKDLMIQSGFKKVEVYTKGYLPLWGKFSDIMCKLDKRHGHFLIATGFK